MSEIMDDLKMIEWVKPSGVKVETNSHPDNIAAAEKMGWKKAPPPIVVVKATPAEVRAGAIDNAMNLVMDDNDSNLMTEAGGPKVESLVAMLGYPITSVERDEAYNRWNESSKSE